MTKKFRKLIGDTASTTSDSEDETRSEESPRSFSKTKNAHRDHTQDLPDVPQVVVDAANKLWSRIKKAASFIMEELGGYRVFDIIAQWIVRNPYITIFLLAGGIAFSLPFIILLGFGISTVVMTLTGFLFLEGTLLTILSMILFGCLAALAIVIIFFSIIAVAIYFGLAHVYNLHGGADRQNNVNSVNNDKPNLKSNTNSIPAQDKTHESNVNNDKSNLKSNANSTLTQNKDHESNINNHKPNQKSNANSLVAENMKFARLVYSDNE